MAADWSSSRTTSRCRDESINVSIRPGNERGPLIKVLFGNDFQLALKWAQKQGKHFKK